MTLSEYLEAEGHGALSRLHTSMARAATDRGETPVAYSTLHAIAHGRSTPRPETAKAIERATKRKVRASTLLGLAA